MTLRITKGKHHDPDGQKVLWQSAQGCDAMECGRSLHCKLSVFHCDEADFEPCITIHRQTDAIAAVCDAYSPSES